MDSSATLIDCAIVENDGAYGGGVYCAGSATLINCLIAGNSASNGGGVCGSASLINCVVAGNRAVNEGGGLYGARLTDGIVTGNTADYGGGAWCDDESALVNCVVTGNVAINAGGVACYGGGLLSGSLIAGNSAWTGGGVRSDDGAPTITSCTVAGNDALRAACLLSFDAVISARSCVLWADGGSALDIASGTASVTYSDVQSGWGGAGNIDADPLFVGGGSGTWTSNGIYDPQNHLVTLTDSAAAWSPVRRPHIRRATSA